MIPSQSYSFSGIVVTLYFCFLFSFFLHTLASPKVHYCRHDQRNALLEFKHEFPMNLEGIDSVYDMSAWNKSSDCCSWETVECDAKGQVISLEIYFMPLNNSLKPNSALFKLQYLQSLTLFSCNLYGEIPSSFGNLSHLTKLDLSYNELVGQVPASIGNLTQLRYLSLYANNFSGKFSVSFANLTKLSTLSVAYNYFEPELLPDMSRFHNLEEFDVGENSFFGPFPTYLFTIPSLRWIDLGGNDFKGPIDFGNISLSSRLQILRLAHNKLNCPIPKSISKFLNLKKVDLSNISSFGPFPTSLLTIPSLQWVNLAGNQFKGPIHFGNTSSLSSLSILDLSRNKFDGPIPESISKFLNLRELDLSNNKLEGKVPGCLWRLETLKLSHNSFSRFGKPTAVLHQTQMVELHLDSNSFCGPFPRPICKLRSLEFLDLSHNSFNGSIPSCLRNFTKSLQVLNLRNNNFGGILPNMFVNATYLHALDISHNRLEGKLPKSLINCKEMKLLNVAGNKFKDKFPSWLGSLLRLNVLILKSNQFYGPLYRRHTSIGFQMLQVIDVSHNDFSGTFPTFYFSNWSKMSQMTTLIPKFGDTYMQFYIGMNDFRKFLTDSPYRNSMEMVHKGVDTEFEKIPKDFMAIDLSKNRFCGKIPESIGLLKGLHLLNLSSNAFTINIPLSLANLTALETLDLSRNQLSGQIPPDLGILSFLSTMDFSHNNLEGPVPRGTQFQRQNCSSFMDNPKLYGLEEICGKTNVPNFTPQESEELSEPEEQVINWIAAAIAYGPGVFCGLVIGYIFVSHKQEWFVEKFSRNKPRIIIRSAR
ncbi:Receptor-like protein 31 [Cardamine amara subsp. amara]|uniref:Receptor-like protein 31 n=1 Tax=Cardamine amara subsp. amara TaxID=228776 RepID=A0ABD1BW90_CARAN